MSNDSKSEKLAQVALRFAAKFDEQPEQDVPVVAYAFDRSGKLLASSPVKAGQAELKLAAGQAPNARVFYAPAPREEKRGPVKLADMERLRAYELTWRFDPESRQYEVLPIPKELWRWWLYCLCRVRGRVVKPEVINGITVEKPVCDARVHICEVDKLPYIIWKLPDYLIYRLRDDLLRTVEKPIFPLPPDFPKPVPPRPFPPDPEPGPFPISPVAGFAEMVSPQPEALRFASEVGVRSEALRAVELPMEFRASLQSLSLQIMREALVANVNWLLPYLCWFDWLHPYLRCDEIKVVETDNQGRFDTLIFYRCFGDKPDLYFWVEYLIEGVWETVYHPPIRCYTYWNYPCGKEVTLRVTDPRVAGCGSITSLPGRDVVLVGIGNGVSVPEIQPSSAGSKAGLTTADQPFAGSLELRMDMGWESLRTLGVTHYRWSYRRLTAGNGTTAVTDTPHLMEREVYRHHKVYVPDPITGLRPAYPAELMGPDPALPGQALIKLLYSGKDWVVRNEHVDMAYAYFETADLPAGVYELSFELFSVTGTTVTPVNWANPPAGSAATPIHAFTPKDPAPFLGFDTVPATDENLIKAGGDVVGMKMLVHVDNNKCVAGIDEAKVGINAAGPCGFIRYPDKNSSTAKIGFTAHHPYQFAKFDFQLVKGSSGVIGPVSFNDAPVGVAGKGYANNPATGQFVRDVPVKDLLDANGSACNSAAFSETIYVRASATNGYHRAEWLDASAPPKAFALAPVPSP